jgi:serine/threonine protein kinase
LKNCFAKNPDDRPTAEDLLSHPWIRAHEENPPDSLDNVGSMQGSFKRTSFSAPNLNNDLPAWLLPYTDINCPVPPPTSSSVLADKFQQQQEEHHNYIHQHHSTQVISHRYVKGTFPKGKGVVSLVESLY